MSFTLHRPLAVLALGLLAASSWAQFTRGNLVVLTATDPGAINFVNDGRNAWSLREVSTAFVPTGYSVNLYAGNAGAAAVETVPFAQDAAPTSDYGSGYLTRSADGRFLMVNGYQARAAGALTSTTFTTSPRQIARIATDGSVSFSAVPVIAPLTGTSTAALRGIFSRDGSDYHAFMSASGGFYFAHGAATGSQMTSTTTIVNGGFVFNGDLMVNAASSAVLRFPGIPTTGTATAVTNFSTTGSAWGNTVIPVSPTTVYTADNWNSATALIVQRWDLIGTTWQQTFGFSVATDATGAAPTGDTGIRTMVYDPENQMFYAITKGNLNAATVGTVPQRFISFPLTTTAVTPAQITRIATSTTTEKWFGLAWAPEAAGGSHAGRYAVAAAKDPSTGGMSRVLFEDGTVSPRTFRLGSQSSTTGLHNSMTLGASIALPTAQAYAVGNLQGADGVNRVVSFDPIARNVYLTLTNNDGSQSTTSAPVAVAAGFTPSQLALGPDGRTYVLMIGRTSTAPTGGGQARIQAFNNDGALPGTPPTAGTLYDNTGTQYTRNGYLPMDLVVNAASIQLLWGGRQGALPGTGSAILANIDLGTEASTDAGTLAITSDAAGALTPVAFDLDPTVGTGRFYVLSVGEGQLFRVDRVALDWSAVTETGTAYRRTPVAGVASGSSTNQQLAPMDIMFDLVNSEARVMLLGRNSGSSVPTLTQNARGAVRMWTVNTGLAIQRATRRMLPGVLPLP